MDAAAPVDRNKIVYIIFVWLGIGTLLPWNFFITQNSYWNERFRDLECVGGKMLQINSNITSQTPVNEESDIDDTYKTCTPNDEMQKMWNSKMAVASMIPNVTMLILNAVFGHRFKTQPRLLVSLVFVIVLFAFTAGMTKVNTDKWQSDFMTLTLVVVVFINLNAAIFQGGLLGVSGKFPPAYIGGVFSGQAVGGIFASVTAVVMIALGTVPRDQAFFCFLVAVIFLAGSLVFYLIITRSEFYQYYLAENVQRNEAKLETINNVDAPITEESEFLDKEKAIINSEEGDGPHPPPMKVVIPHKVNPLQIFGKISIYAISVFTIFLVTLACFPALTLLTGSVNGNEYKVWATKYFIPVCCFVLFNVGDYLGRFAAEKLQWPMPPKVYRHLSFAPIAIMALSLSRIVFIPLFMYCKYFESDTAYIVIMLLFSLSNGYISNICMMSGPKISHPDDQMTAASLMVAFLGLGLGAGAALSNVFTALSKHV